jgi:hypothetical protein
MVKHKILTKFERGEFQNIQYVEILFDNVEAYQCQKMKGYDDLSLYLQHIVMMRLEREIIIM